MCRSLMPHAILSKVVPKKRFTSQSWKITVTEPGLCHKIGWGGEGGLHVLLPSPNAPLSMSVWPPPTGHSRHTLPHPHPAPESQRFPFSRV